MCEELKNIIEACLKENQESSENLEDMEEGELEQRIRNFLKWKKYSDLKTSLSWNNEWNGEFVRNENTLEPSYNIQFSSLSLDVWDNLKDGTIYEIYINQVGKGDKKEELIKLYRLLTNKIKS